MVRLDPSKVVSVARQPTPALDRPWHRPGPFRYAVARLRGFARPPVTVTEPPEEIVIDCDAAIVTATERCCAPTSSGGQAESAILWS